jgi:glycosyltransferase involved in cell wall biosynthesis
LKLSILVPIYNEVDTMVSVVEQIRSVALEKEVILVDDFSSDGTRELIKEKFGNDSQGIKIIYHERNKGKGAAIKTALMHAAGDYAIIQDADLEYDPQDYVRLLEAAIKGKAEVVFGSRFKKTWKVTSFWHFLVNKVLTEITNLLFGAKLTDMETCYKMIKTDLFKSLNIESQRFEIEAEITAKLLKKGHAILEVPISYKGRSYHEGKKITWKDGFVAVWALFKYRFK